MAYLSGHTRALGAALAILLSAGALGGQGGADASEASLREAAFEVIFAQDEATVEKHLADSTQQFLDETDPQVRTRFLRDLMLAASEKARGAKLRRLAGDAPIVRIEDASGQDVSEISLTRVEVAGRDATVELEVRRWLRGRPVPQGQGGPRHFTLEARQDDGVWRLLRITLENPSELVVSLEGAQMEDGLMAANEAAAVGSLRTLNVAEITYSATYPEAGFACTLELLSGPGTGKPDEHHSELIDSVLASGHKDGYLYTLSGCSGRPAGSYTITAVPAVPWKSGRRAFCTDETGVAYYSEDGQAETCLGKHTPLQ